jgi:hypothetical protein
MKASDRNILRGIENIMMDMLDNPEWLHRKRFWNIRLRHFWTADSSEIQSR